MKILNTFLAIGAALQLAAQGAPVSPAKNICNTPQCRLVAEGILKDLNTKADPCIDFSQYTCGGFYERETIPDDSSSIGYLSIMQTKNNELVEHLLIAGDPQAPKAAKGDEVARRNIQRMQDYNAACIDEDQLTKIGRQPLVDQLQQLVKLYSVQGSLIQQDKTTENNDKRALSITIGQMLRRKLVTFVHPYMQPDIHNPTRNLMYLYPGGLGLGSTDIYSNPNVTQFYEQVIGAMFYLTYSQEDPVGKQEKIEVPEIWTVAAKEVVAFEKAFAEVIAPTEGRYDPAKDHNVLSLAEVSQRAPSLDWSLLFENALPSDVKVPKNVVVGEPTYLNQLNDLLKSTKPQTMQLYLAWSMIQELGKHIDAGHRAPLDALTRAFSNDPEAPLVRSKTCAALTSDSLLDIISHYFVEATFPQRAIDEVDEAIEALRATYTKSFKTYKWLDSFTRKGALEKVKGFLHKIGYSASGPDDASPTSIDQFYKPLLVDGHDHFGNQIRAHNFWTQIEFRKLNKKVDRMHMDMSAPTVNAYYSPASNDINMPAGILQLPFFHVDNPEYLNYGAMGTVAGHELTHGFDNSGREWDSIGRYRNWWSNSSLAAFNERAQCFVDQYSKYTIPGPDGKELSVDGELTLGENIADNGGIKKSYESWLARYESDRRSEKYNNKRLPGLENFSPEQLFFIQYARLWCIKSRPEAASLFLEDEHSPGKWRINGVAQNSKYFAKAFKCQTGTPMNPAKKCDLW